MSKLTNEQVALILKSALDFNAAVVALAAFYGNMDDMKNIKQFDKNYKQIFKGYNEQLKSIIGADDNA